MVQFHSKCCHLHFSFQTERVCKTFHEYNLMFHILEPSRDMEKKSATEERAFD